jgi:hypothetical protein
MAESWAHSTQYPTHDSKELTVSYSALASKLNKEDMLFLGCNCLDINPNFSRRTYHRDMENTEKE